MHCRAHYRAAPWPGACAIQLVRCGLRWTEQYSASKLLACIIHFMIFVQRIWLVTIWTNSRNVCLVVQQLYKPVCVVFYRWKMTLKNEFTSLIWIRIIMCMLSYNISLIFISCASLNWIHKYICLFICSFVRSFVTLFEIQAIIHWLLATKNWQGHILFCFSSVGFSDPLAQICLLFALFRQYENSIKLLVRFWVKDLLVNGLV